MHGAAVCHLYFMACRLCAATSSDLCPSLLWVMWFLPYFQYCSPWDITWVTFGSMSVRVLQMASCCGRYEESLEFDTTLLTDTEIIYLTFRVIRTRFCGTRSHWWHCKSTVFLCTSHTLWFQHGGLVEVQLPKKSIDEINKFPHRYPCPRALLSFWSRCLKKNQMFANMQYRLPVLPITKFLTRVPVQLKSLRSIYWLHLMLD